MAAIPLCWLANWPAVANAGIDSKPSEFGSGGGFLKHVGGTVPDSRGEQFSRVVTGIFLKIENTGVEIGFADLFLPRAVIVRPVGRLKHGVGTAFAQEEIEHRLRPRARTQPGAIGGKLLAVVAPLRLRAMCSQIAA